MSRRAPHARGGRAPRIGAVGLAALLTGSLVRPVAWAQPAPPPAAELSRARELYKSAEAATSDGRFDDAVRDYRAAYELSKDPALFYKIGRANERAGKCDVALIYYARYLREGNPSASFAATTRERITACGGDVNNLPGSAASSEPGPGANRGSTGAPVAAGGATAASPREAGHATGEAEPTAGSGAATPAPAAPTLAPSNRHKAAWLLTGGAIAMATLGGVLANAASSSENDVRDLYLGFAGQPPAFDAQTRKRYDDLVDQGHRYQHLSWASLGLAGAAAAGAAVLFVLGGHREAAPQARVTPVVTTTSAGLAVRF
jgi:tetratricopeptide (TPR) repeat protein